MTETALNSYFDETDVTIKVEKWTWGENDLQKVTYYDTYDGEEFFNTFTTFTYDNKSRISRVVYLDGAYLEYNYDGNKLKEVNYIEGGSLVTKYTITYTNGKVTKIEEFFNNDYKQGSVGRNFRAMQLVLGKELAKIVSDGFRRHPSKSDDKGNTVYTMDFTWNNGNITNIEYSSVSDGEDWRENITLEYDTYNNPYYNCFWVWEGVLKLSKNNCKKVYGSYDNTYFYYEYTYTGNYPQAQRYYRENGDLVNVVEYEYVE